MGDPRIKNIAGILVRYSIAAKARQSVGVSGDRPAEPLFLALHEEILRVGAFPVVRMFPPGLDEILFRCGKPHHFTTLIPCHRSFARDMDASIRILASTNTRALSNADPARQTDLARTMRPIHNIMLKKPWVLTLFPTEAYAQDAEMSLSEFEDFAYGAMFAEEKDPVGAWRRLGERQEKMVAGLRGADAIRIVGPGTDLRLSVKGRTFLSSDGRHNLPSGEIYTGPVESATEGHIEYDFPVCHAGREMSGIRLVFRKGRVVEASARKNEAFLLTMLKADAGAGVLGELGIGTNERIQRFTKNILFDEKIGGTVHLAVGRAYPETGGVNKSAIHWDMIKDLRRGGTVYVDGKPFMKDGKFVR